MSPLLFALLPHEVKVKSTGGELTVGEKNDPNSPRDLFYPSRHSNILAHAYSTRAEVVGQQLENQKKKSLDSI